MNADDPEISVRSRSKNAALVPGAGDAEVLTHRMLHSSWTRPSVRVGPSRGRAAIAKRRRRPASARRVGGHATAASRVDAPPSNSARSARGSSSSSTGASSIGRAGEHEDVLAARLADVDRAERPAHDLLVQLGQFPRHDDHSIIPARLAQVGERALDAMRRLVEHRSCAVSAAISARRSARSRPLRGRKPSNTNRSVGSPLIVSAMIARARSGDRADRVAGVDHRPHDPLARIGDAGRAGVADDRHLAAVAEHLEHVGDAGELGVVVADGEPLAP